MTNNDTNLTDVTTAVVAAYVGANNLPADAIPDLIRTVHWAFNSLSEPAEAPAPAVTATASQIRRSITPSALISFEDQQPYKQLKRHLATRGLTPDEYRAKWGLPANYPMVAAEYSAKRSAVAKAAGFGRKSEPGKSQTVAPLPSKAKVRGKLSLFGKREPL